MVWWPFFLLLLSSDVLSIVQTRPSNAQLKSAAIWLRDQLIGGRTTVTGLELFDNRERIVPAGPPGRLLYYGYIIHPGTDRRTGDLNWNGRWRSVVETDAAGTPTGRYRICDHTDYTQY